MNRVKVEFEYLFKASPNILYAFFTAPANLVRWFCDDVNINRDIYTFEWSGSEEIAELVDDIEEERIKFVWLDRDQDDEYLEVFFNLSPVTGETILTIHDFCDDDEQKDHKDLWDSQIKTLRQETGS